MTRKYEYKGQEYWITVDNAIHPETHEGVFVVFVKNEEPGLIFGESIKNENGKPIFFTDINNAFIYTQDIMQSEIDGGVQVFF